MAWSAGRKVRSARPAVDLATENFTVSSSFSQLLILLKIGIMIAIIIIIMNLQSRLLCLNHCSSPLKQRAITNIAIKLTLPVKLCISNLVPYF